MLEDPHRHPLRDQVRAWLGVDHLHTHLRRIEDTMAKVIDLLNGLIAQNTAASAAQASSFHNIDAAFQRLQDALNSQDQADPQVQAAVDELSAGFASLQKAAEDEGRLYGTPDVTGDQPDQPANAGDTPPAGDNTGDAPVADNTTR